MPLQCNHGPQLLCCVALCFLGSGESWEQTKNPALGLPTPSTLSGSLLDFVYSFSMGPIGVKVIQTPGHLVKAKDRKQGWSVYPTKDILFLISINGSRKKELEFFISFQNEQVLDQIKLVQEGIFSYTSPKLTLKPGNPVLWARRLHGVFLCQQSIHSTEVLLPLNAQIHHGPKSENVIYYIGRR